jgi:hypothetical protein
MYYKYDKTENGTTTRPQTTFRFNLALQMLISEIHITDPDLL